MELPDLLDGVKYRSALLYHPKFLADSSTYKLFRFKSSVGRVEEGGQCLGMACKKDRLPQYSTKIRTITRMALN